jgi:hypothetical protein
MRVVVWPAGVQIKGLGFTFVMFVGFRARGCTPSLLGEYAMWGLDQGVGFTFYSFPSQFASFSLYMVKPLIMFQSTVEGVDPRVTTL